MRLLSLSLLLLACDPTVELGGPDRERVSDPVDTATGPTTTSKSPVDTSEPPPADCVPDEAAFEANARPAIEAKCASCHTSPPEFGAPFSLLDYAPLVTGEPGRRIVDRMVTALVDGAMPPANAEALTHAELDTLTSWASCGEVHPDPGDGLVASQPVFEPPPDPPKGAEAIEITGVDFVVGPTMLDRYQRFRFGELVTEDRFIQRIEPVVDESRVVHHITLQSSTGRYLYTWAPGTDAIHLPDGGLRLRPDDVLTVEIHYNNGAGLPDITDSSGMRLWLVDDVDTEYTMVEPSTWAIGVPPKGTATATATCEAKSDFTVIAGMPHMHETGSTFETVLRRADGTEESMLELTGWAFEAQYFYEMPFEVSEGDIVEVVCGYDNPYDRWVTAGQRTQDEMCFNFMYVTPPDAQLDCPFF